MRFPSCFLPALLIVVAMAPMASAEVDVFNDMFLWLTCDDDFHVYPPEPMDFMLDDNANNYDVAVVDQFWYTGVPYPPYDYHTSSAPGKVNGAAYFGAYPFAAADHWYPHGRLRNDPDSGCTYDEIYWLDKPEAMAPSSKVTVATWVNADFLFHDLSGTPYNETIFYMEGPGDLGRISLRVQGTKVDLGSGLVDGAGIEFQLSNGTTQIIDFNYGDSASEYLSPDVVVGEWLHIAATYDRDAGIAELYLNGAKVADMPISNSLNICDSNDDWDGGYWRWDRTYGEGTHAFFGYMDEFYIFNRALDADDVAFLAGRESTPGNVNYDWVVDNTDIETVLQNFGQTSGCDWEDGDFTGDGAVDAEDLTWLAINTNWMSLVLDPEEYPSNEHNGFLTYNWDDEYYLEKVDLGIYPAYPFPDPITNPTALPEPSMLMMLAGSLALLAALRLRKRSN